MPVARRGSILNILLVVGASSAVLLAIGVVVGIFALLRLLPGEGGASVAVHKPVAVMPAASLPAAAVPAAAVPAAPAANIAAPVPVPGDPAEEVPPPARRRAHRPRPLASRSTPAAAPADGGPR